MSNRVAQGKEYADAKTPCKIHKALIAGIRWWWGGYPFVPVRFKKRGIRKVVITPEGVGEPAESHTRAAIAPVHDSVLLSALGRAYYWQHLIDSGAVADTAEIAQRAGIIGSTVCEVLRLALLAPDIAEAAVAGRLLRTVSLERLLWDGVPRDWGEQRGLIGGMVAQSVVTVRGIFPGSWKILFEAFRSSIGRYSPNRLYHDAAS